MKMESIAILLHESKLFIDGLNQVVKLLSPLLFWITSALMVNMIVLSFTSIIQLMDTGNGSMEWYRQGLFISCGILAFGFLYLTFQLCHLSEMLVVNVGELEVLIIDYQFKNGESRRQKDVCNLLSKFKGFDANGYFTLNHSMLTGMIASIVTYLVIVVQFRQSGV